VVKDFVEKKIASSVSGLHSLLQLNDMQMKVQKHSHSCLCRMLDMPHCFTLASGFIFSVSKVDDVRKMEETQMALWLPTFNVACARSIFLLPEPVLTYHTRSRENLDGLMNVL